jgi:hypothetical protein
LSGESTHAGTVPSRESGGEEGREEERSAGEVTDPSLIAVFVVIAWSAGWIGYFIGRRKEAKWRECAT